MFLAITMGIAAPGCKRALVLPTIVVDAARIRTVADVPPDREPSRGQTRVLGNGWYANVEVDGRDGIHLAWTDADLGDVMYAVMAAGEAEPGEAAVVEHEGAVGSYLKLALAPGDVPVLAYYHQDQRTLRLAHRPRDLEAMAASGARLGAKATVVPTRVLVPGENPSPPPETGMGEGWHGEEVAFGDNAGLAGDLALDDEGVPHLIYYTKNERLRYATRPDGTAAFGSDVHNVFDKHDIDERAGGSYTMSTDVAVIDGVVVASYCHWNYIDSQLKVALKRRGERAFTVVEATPLERMVDGWHSTVLAGDEPGRLDVFSVSTGEAKLMRGVLDVKEPRPLEGRVTVVDRPGPAEVKRAPDGTLWVLTRGLGLAALDEEAGMWLIRVPDGGAGAERWLLERGIGRDPWIDLALKRDGTPVAVWTSRETLSMKLYVHQR